MSTINTLTEGKLNTNSRQKSIPKNECNTINTLTEGMHKSRQNSIPNN
jgi:hypothetical protein